MTPRDMTERPAVTPQGRAGPDVAGAGRVDVLGWTSRA